MSKIGIIGGAGVAATNKLLELIENHYTMAGAFRDMHHPEMIVYQATQVPSRSMYLEGRGDSFIDGYIDVANKLVGAGADKICMCCNTAHCAINQISQSVDAEFIDLIAATVNTVKKTSHKDIGIIASDGALLGKVYERMFNKIHPDTTLIYPDKEYQELVTLGICNVKNKTRFFSQDRPERSRNIFGRVVDHLKAKGCTVIILACTDIACDFDYSRDYEVDIIDSLSVLAECIIKEAGKKNEQ